LQLAADFHLHTVAEGVEEVEQLEILSEFGCEAVQGFLFARPQPLADIVNLLNKGLQLPESTSILGATDGPGPGRDTRRGNPNDAAGSEIHRLDPKSAGEPASVAVL
jgi:hypothetical protein